MDTTKTIIQPISHLTTNSHILVLIIIIVLAGILGGIVNYFMNNISKTWDKYDLSKGVFLGIVASATVPLFLETVSSKLIYDSQQEHLKYFVFGGFCLLASVFSSKFLQSLSDRILKELTEVKKDTKDNKDKVDAIVSQQSDDRQTEKTPAKGLLMSNPEDDSTKVIEELQDNKFTFRTISGLAKASNADENSVKTILSQLEKNDYVKQINRSDGVIIWTLTAKGQKLDLSANPM